MYYLGVDLGGTGIKAGICDENGKILYKETCPTDSARGGEGIVSDMAALCLRVIKECSLTIEDIEYAGVASPGTADSERGVIVYASTLPFLNFPLAARLSELTGIKKVYIDNDANAAAMGEAAFGAAKGCKDSVMITLGTGVGGGIIIDRKVYSGFNFAGAEVGHIVIIHGGEECTCGRKGCWESYASATALVAQTKEMMRANPDSLMWELCGGDINNAGGRTSFDAMRKGDPAGRKTVDNYIGYIACGLINMINIFQPEILSIGGGISNERDYLLKPLKEIVDREQYSRHSEKKTDIRIAMLGNDAGIIGAASLGIL